MADHAETMTVFCAELENAEGFTLTLGSLTKIFARHQLLTIMMSGHLLCGIIREDEG
jgi:hypothetical protein